jgi:uncharacterized protein YwqG
MLIVCAVLAGLVILVVRYPRHVLQSLRRWGRDDLTAPALPRAASESFSMAAARMRRLARPTLLLAPTKDPGFSKLGGEPETPPGVEWPMGLRTPRAFLVQLDLMEVHRAGGPDWLPTEGRLYAFYDPMKAGESDQVSIAFSDGLAGAPSTPPSTLPDKLRFPQRRVGFLPFTSTPSLDWLGLDVSDLDVSESELDQLANMPDEPFGDELQHRIGGYPSEIQEAQMALECEHLARGLPEPVWGEDIPPAIKRASKEWRLLLQIDSDPALKMNFGDGGRLYVFIRERHARVGDFSKTVTLWQTY